MAGAWFDVSSGRWLARRLGTSGPTEPSECLQPVALCARMPLPIITRNKLARER